MTKKIGIITVAVGLAVSQTACVTTQGVADNDAPECSIGAPAYMVGAAVLGAIAGGLLAKNNPGQGAVLGGIAGTAVGMAANHFISERCKKIEEAKKRLGGINVTSREIEVQSSGITWTNPGATQPTAKASDEGLATNISTNSMFEVGSAELSAVSRQNFRTLAEAYKGTENKILIVGHTDSLGEPDRNLLLSENRAKAVADIFASVGIPRSNIYYKGAGATRPIADNATEAGRARNRRVEVVELRTEDGILAYEFKQDANPDYLRRSSREVTTKTLEPVAQVPTQPASPTPASPQSTSSKPTAADVGTAQDAKKFAQAKRPGGGIDFGGVPVDGKGIAVDGAIAAKQPTGLSAGFNFISRAFAANEPSFAGTSCLSDPNPKSGVVRSLNNNREVKRRTSEYLPGLFGTSWSQTVNGNLAAITDVRVLRETAEADSQPTVIVFKDFKEGQQKPTLQATGLARGFEGEGAVLYRVFLNEEAWPLRCVDLVFDLQAPGKTKFGRLYYDKEGAVHVVDYMPTIAK